MSFDRFHVHTGAAQDTSKHSAHFLHVLSGYEQVQHCPTFLKLATVGVLHSTREKQRHVIPLEVRIALKS